MYVFFNLLILPMVSATVVRTYISSQHCPGCEKWTSMINDAAPLFPNLEFETLEFDYESATANTALPYTTVNNTVYSLPQRSDYLHRWLLDVSEGRHTVIVRNVSVHHKWYSGFDSWVHILSAEYPNVEHHARNLLSTGFGWTFMNGTSFFNTVMYQRVDGRMLMKHNVIDMSALICQLLPPIIPFAMSETKSVRQLLQYFDSSLYMVAPLVPSLTLPYVAVIHMTGNESAATERNMSVPSAWVWKRQVGFMLPSVEASELKLWYYGIKNGTTEPVYRPSVFKQGDVSGDELWSWVHSRENALVFEYNSEETFEECQSALESTMIDVGPMDVRTNDHESFPEWSVPGMAHYYKDGKLVTTSRCGTILSLILVDKTEL